MDTTKAQNIINAIIKETCSHAARRQYPPSKRQLKSLADLGITNLMPRKFGYTDAAAVIEAATDAGGKEEGGFNREGEGESWRTEPSALYRALHSN